MNGLKLIQPRLNYSFPLRNIIDAFKLLLFNSNRNEENNLNKYFNREKILFFNSGHSALQFFLEQLPHNTRVGVQSLTCPTVFESILNAKCKLVFVDINNQLLIDQNSLKNKFKDIDVIILTHTFGCAIDVQLIKSVLENKIIIEDCAHAFLSTINSSLVGKAGDVSIFSHGFAKFPSVFGGGYMLFNNENYFNSMKSHYEILPTPKLKQSIIKILQSVIHSILNFPIVYTFITKKLKQKKLQNFNYVYNSDNEVKKNYLFSEILLNSELKNIEEYLKLQKNNGKRILEAIEQNSNFRICQNNEGINFFMLPVFVKNPSLFIEYAQKNGIEIGQHFVQSRKIIDKFGYKEGDCENYEQIVNELITIPTHYNYSSKKIDQLIDLIISYNK